MNWPSWIVTMVSDEHHLPGSAVSCLSTAHHWVAVRRSTWNRIVVLVTAAGIYTFCLALQKSPTSFLQLRCWVPSNNPCHRVKETIMASSVVYRGPWFSYASPNEIWALATVLPAVCILIVGLRFYVRKLQKERPDIGDWLIVPALVGTGHLHFKPLFWKCRTSYFILECVYVCCMVCFKSSDWFRIWGLVLTCHAGVRKHVMGYPSPPDNITAAGNTSWQQRLVTIVRSARF